MTICRSAVTEFSCVMAIRNSSCARRPSSSNSAWRPELLLVDELRERLADIGGSRSHNSPACVAVEISCRDIYTKALSPASTLVSLYSRTLRIGIVG
jgi:hypothetical protein